MFFSGVMNFVYGNRKIFRNIILRILIVFVMFAYTETVFQIASNTIGYGIFRALFFYFINACLIVVMTLPLRKLSAFLVTLLTVLFFVILASSQLIFNKIFYSFFTIYAAINGGEALQFYDVIFSAISKNILTVFLLLLPIVALIAIWRIGRFPSVEPVKFSYVSFPAMILVALLGIFIIPLAKDPTSAYSRKLGQGSIKNSVSEVGMLTTMQVDLMAFFVKSSPSSALANVLAVQEPIKLEDGNKLESDNNEDVAKDDKPAITLTPAPVQTQTPPWVGKTNSIDIDFEKLMEEDNKNSRLSSLHQYFSSLAPSNQNERTGSMEGYNLIYLVCEAFSHLAVDPELTPTLYKMQHEGIYFSNFYNPPWGGSTTDGEYAACTGLIPKGGGVSFRSSVDKYLPFVMGNQLKALGYQTNAYHNNDYDYYRRNLTHPNMGYDYKGRGNGLDVQAIWPGSDLEMMEKSVDEYINADKFHAYYMTVSGHLKYIFAENKMAAKNRDRVEHLPYSDSVKAYLAAQIELDYAMNYLLQRLEEAGLAEKTLIVMVADHYPYGLTNEEISELQGHEVDEAFELYKSSLIMYVKGMTPEVIDSPVSTQDIIPTISNLLGLRFDSRLLSGRDIYSDAEPLVFFPNRNFITEYGYYDSSIKKFTPNEGVTYVEGYTESILSIINARFAAAVDMLDLNYYERLREYIDPKPDN